MLNLHPEILRKDGKEQFVVLPHEEFVAIMERLEDAEDVLELREAKRKEADAPTVGIDEVSIRFGVER